MPCTSDRWSLMLQLTSNLASVIIKLSSLDVTLCSQQTHPPPLSPHMCSNKKILFCDRGSSNEISCACAQVCLGLLGAKWGSEAQGVPECSLKWGFVTLAGVT